MIEFTLSVWGALGSLREKIRKKWFTFILYHRIEPRLFEKHLEYLQYHYIISDLKLVKDYYTDQTPLPENALFITFDDGWRSNYDLLPIVEEKNLPVTIFLTTGLIGSNQKPPPISHYQDKPITDIDYPAELERTMLNVQEIKEMSKIINFQSHGVNHHHSKTLSNDQLRSELIDSKNSIEKLSGKTVYAFAYPYNRAGKREAEIVESSGYILARMGGRKMNSSESNPFLLNAIGIEEKCSVKELHKKLLSSELKTILRK